MPSLWAQVKQIHDFAATAGEPITDDVTMRLSLEMFDKTGVLNDAIKVWNRLAAAAQTDELFILWMQQFG